jgi:hypothetical protein
VTAEALADLLHARHAGHGRWQAKCPAHQDCSPSLSIREGREGRVLLHCFAGCTTEAVLRFAGLKVADLFAGPPPTLQQAAATALERAGRDAETLQARREQSRLAARYRKLNAVLDEIAARLARTPDGAESAVIARLFHKTLETILAIDAVYDAAEQRAFHERLTQLMRESERFREAA